LQGLSIPSPPQTKKDVILMGDETQKRKETCPYQLNIDRNTRDIEHVEEDIHHINQSLDDIKKQLAELNNGGLSRAIQKQNVEFMERYMKYHEMLVEQEAKRMEVEQQEQEAHDKQTRFDKEMKWKIITLVVTTISGIIIALIKAGII
jgi:chromosome segregation ATPase